MLALQSSEKRDVPVHRCLHRAIAHQMIKDISPAALQLRPDDALYPGVIVFPDLRSAVLATA